MEPSPIWEGLLCRDHTGFDMNRQNDLFRRIFVKVGPGLQNLSSALLGLGAGRMWLELKVES